MSKDELEKEAEEINITYENNVFHCTKNGTKWISIDGEKWYGEEKRIEELEKENAELKAKNKWYSEQVCNKECAEVWRNLTEAKEHIKQLLDCLKQDTNDPETNYYVCQYMDKAEQFLKGENIILEDAQAGNSPFDADEVFNKEMKAYTDEKVK